MSTVWKILTSLRLTVICLSFGIVLVWIGTVAQADEGLYQAQARYFKHWMVWGATLWGHKIPLILPGGYLIGTVLLVNLVCAHIKRFDLSRKKIGINLTHAGVILLLLGQLATDMLSYESHLSFQEGETRHYSEGHREYELAFTRDAGADKDEVVAIPSGLLAKGGTVTHEKLPFSVKVQKFWPNSSPSFRAPAMKNSAPLATNGIAQDYDFIEAPDAKTMDDKNFPTAVIELSAAGSSLGTWIVSGWSSDPKTAQALKISFTRQFGAQLAASMIAKLTPPQTVEVAGTRYTFALRPERVYHDFGISLLKTTHEVYPGTITSANTQGIPKNFQSRVRLENEKREVEIYMNSPLRYAGLTFFQYQMGRDEMGERGNSTLQVVRNPSWITPYIGCGVVGLGMLVQFLYHLVAFTAKRRGGAVA